MSENNSDWDPFRPIFRRQSANKSVSSTSGTSVEVNINADELMDQIKELSSIYRQRRRNSSQTFDLSFENMDITISSSDDSEESDDNSLDNCSESLNPTVDYDSKEDFESVCPSTESGGQISSDSHKQSEECISQTISENPTNSSSDSGIGLRRSKRKRIPVMESWRGQRPVYKRDSSGITDVIAHIEEGTPYEVIPKASKPKKKKKRKNDNKSNQKRDIFNLSIHKKVKINDENENSIDIQSLNRFNWKTSTQSKGVDIAIINKNREKGVAVGMIRIEGFGEKTMSKTGDYVTHLTVFLGVLNLKIDDKKPVVVRTGNAFVVNSKTSYSLVNLRKDEAYISFTVFSD